jgi:hypothetical protein
MAQTASWKSDDLQLRLHKVKLNAFEQLEQLRTLVVALEKLHDIQERWTASSDEWKSAVAYMEICNCQKALDKLKGLVEQRLFELTKMGLAGTGKELFQAVYRLSFSLAFYRLQDACSYQQGTEDAV